VPTIIDGYNLLRTCGFVGARVGPGTLERARGMFLGFLAQVFAPEDRGEVTVVFDSAVRLPDMPDYVLQNGIHVHFATGHRDADEMIIDLLQRHSAPKSLMIVSSDHQIQRAAQRRKARFCDSDRWYELTIEANRGNPQVVATAAEIQLEIQLLRKELAVSAPDPEQEQLLSEFSKSIAALLPAPTVFVEPDSPPVLDLAAKPPTAELKHGKLSDTLAAEIDKLLDLDSFQATLGERLKRSSDDKAAGRRLVTPVLPPKSAATTTPPNAATNSASNAASSAAVPEDLAAAEVPVAPQQTEARSVPPALGKIVNETAPSSGPPGSNVSPEVPTEQLERWNRQLKHTDTTIFPPGYGEDIFFSESFEIDDRLKKKRRP
jgi:predicted RNA-binding protein with PIN domain